MNEHSEPVSQADPRRLLRRRDGRVLGGVAGGLADAAGVDPVLVRVGFAALTFLGGVGLLLYLVLWALLPDRPGGESIAETLLRRLSAAPAWVRVTLLVLAVWAAVGGLEPVSGAAVLVLVVIGAVALRRDGRTSGQP